MRSERQALADIAKLCDEPTDIGLPRGRVEVGKLRAILADVQPEPVLMSRTDFTDPLDVIANQWLRHLEVHYDRSTVEDMAEDFRPDRAPAGGTIDRDALTKLLLDLFEHSMFWGRGDSEYEPDIEAYLDAVLALVRPVKGVVVLTPEEATFVARSVSYAIEEVGPRPDLVALAERLEAAS